MKSKISKFRDLHRFVKMSLICVFCWYSFLYPGRLDSDGSAAMLMISRGDSTNWWTSSYFWFLRISTFGGNSIAITCLILLVSLYYAISYFIWSLPLSVNKKSQTLFVVTLSPVFGNFGVNLSHDVFTTSGIIILTGHLVRLNLVKSQKINNIPLLLATFFLSNSISGIGILFIFICLQVVYLRQFRIGGILAALTVAIFVLSSLGITRNPTDMPMLPLLADIKCVVQHADVELTPNQQKTLFMIAKESIWKDPKSCASIDVSLSDFKKLSQTKVDRNGVIRAYLELFVRYPEIIIQAHLQRASVALPPPFFAGPVNMIERDTTSPIGLGTNTALQSGSIVVHPSIDLEKFRVDNNFHRIFESLALLPGYLMNQASWFWGWGGIWLWPFTFFILFKIGISSLRRRLIILTPVAVNHAILIAVGPVPSPRYVMATIIMGMIAMYILVSDLIEKRSNQP